MASQPLSINDILMLPQAAWKIGRAFTRGAKSTPSEFAEIEKELNRLSEALELVAEAINEDASILSQAEAQTKYAVNSILESARKTLQDLGSFVDRYQVIKNKDTRHGSVAERSWSSAVLADYRTIKWTTGGGGIQALRNMLRMHIDCIDLTRQAIQSRSLARLEKTVVPMAQHVASMQDKSRGDQGQKAGHVHEVMMKMVNSTPSLGPRGRIDPMDNRGVRGSSSRTPTSPISDWPLCSTEHRMLDSRAIAPHVRVASHHNPKPSGKSEDERHCARIVDWNFETGSPPDLRGSISHGRDWCNTSPQDSAYAGESSRRTSFRRESATLPVIFTTVGEKGPASVGRTRDNTDDQQSDTTVTPPLPAKSLQRQYPHPRAPSSPQSPSDSSSAELLPPPAIPVGKQEPSHTAAATPATFFSTFRWSKTEVHERPPTATSSMPSPSPDQQALQVAARRMSQKVKFEQQLFRNAAILCDVRGRLVEYAQYNPKILDVRYNVEMKTACKECRICVVRKRENREHGGTKVVTSVWCLSADNEVRLQQRLSETQESVPYCSYFEPEKVSLQPTNEPGAELRFHAEEWGGLLKEEKKTHWVNYYFTTPSDAINFQSAVFGRLLLGSFRTTKTTVIHEGLKGAFAFEEQFANIEMLRLWEEDGVKLPGAAGGVMALMHISSNFGQGWARWWINNSRQPVRVKEDGSKHARVKGIDVTVVKPGASARQAEQARSASGGGVTSPVAAAAATTADAAAAAVEKDSFLKKVGGVRMEFSEEMERQRFVEAVRLAQVRSMPLPEL